MGPQIAEDLEAVSVRQVEVQQDEIKEMAGEQGIKITAGTGFADNIPFDAEIVAHGSAQPDIILKQQQTATDRRLPGAGLMRMQGLSVVVAQSQAAPESEVMETGAQGPRRFDQTVVWTIMPLSSTDRAGYSTHGR